MLFELRDLTVAYRDRVAVTGASLAVGGGEAVGVVGPSGSGKSTLVAASLRLLPEGGRVTSGSARFRGEDLLAAGPARLRELRGAQIGYVLQDAMRALNPTMRCGDQVIEAMTEHGSARDGARDRLGDLLALVELGGEHGRAYPHELSGGQRQRIALAAAMANEPGLLVADEPTTGLDVVAQRGLLDLLAGLRARRGLALVLISHDPRLVARLCDRVERLPPGRHARSRGAAGCATTDRPECQPRQPGASNGAVSVLELRGASVAYRRRASRRRAFPALCEVDLKVGFGEIVGVVGRSGAGKSTLAQLAVGLVKPSTGEVRLDGRLLAARGPALRRARRSAHLIFQDAYDALPGRLSVERVLAEPLVIRRERVHRRRLCDTLTAAGLRPAEEFLARVPAELSGGECQRVALARALVSCPRLVVADEPTSMLDLDLQIELIDRIRAARDRDATAFLFITHDLFLAQRLCDRIVVLCEGRVAEHGRPDEVLAAPRAAETRALVEAASL